MLTAGFLSDANLVPVNYNRLVRLLKKQIPVRLELEVEARFHEETLESANVIAEIPGRSKKDENVMPGAHLDSRHGGTGAGCAVGLPGFQFIQDAIEYGTRTHHSNLDVYDNALASGLMQASAMMASFVSHAATRPQMPPRKPLPKPKSKGDEKSVER